MAEIPARWISCDPGSQHFGFAEWSGTECLRAVELTPLDAQDEIIRLTGEGLNLIVMESYVLYAWLARQQAGSDMPVSRIIGGIELIARLRGVPVLFQTASVGKRPRSLEPWRSAPKRAWPSWSHGEHAGDAYVHGAAYLMRVHKRVPDTELIYS